MKAPFWYFAHSDGDYEKKTNEHTVDHFDDWCHAYRMWRKERKW